MLYENLAYVARSAAPVPGRRARRLAAPRTAAALGVRPRRRGAARRRRPSAPGTVLWGEAYDSAVGARRRGGTIAAARARRSDGRTAPRSTQRGTVAIALRRAMAALGDARRRARDLALRALALAAHPCARDPAARATAARARRERRAARPTRSPTCSTRTPSGGSGCERRADVLSDADCHARTRAGAGPSRPEGALAVRSSSSCWPRWSRAVVVAAARVARRPPTSSAATAALRSTARACRRPTRCRRRGTAPRERRRPTAAPTRPSSSPACADTPSTPPSP